MTSRVKKLSLRHAAGVLALAVGLSGLSAVVAATPAQAAVRTAISLTFDDATDSQYQAFQAMAARGMKGTVYANSAFVGLPGYMTLAQLQAIQASGSEVGGHTVSHQNFLTLPDAEVSRQICQDRTNLIGWGLNARSFAYPFADFLPQHETIVKNCGYNSGRQVGDLRSPVDCLDCPAVETRPAADPYAVRTTDEIDPTWTLAQMKAVVTRAEARGGWTILVFHKLSTDKTVPSSISPVLFTQFLDWLRLRVLIGTQTQTMSDVVGGVTKPAVAGTPAPPPGAPGVNVVNNPSLETLNPYGTGNPNCWNPAGYGVNTPVYSRVGGAHTGAWAEQVQLTSRTDGDAKIIPTFDLGNCTPSVTVGHTYTVSAWYKSTSQVFFTLYQRNAVGQWAYWTQSPRFAPSTGWTQVSWTTPAVPNGMLAASFGLTLDSVGTLVTDDYSFSDGPATPTPAPPGVNALQNADLNIAGAYGFPQCWTGTGYGTNTPVWTTVTNPTDNSPAVQLQMTSYTDGDNKLVPIFDNGNCAPSVTVGHPYTVSAGYTSTAPVFWTLYKRDAAGVWSYWTQSPTFPASSTWATAAWTSPVVPAGVTGVSLGLTLNALGTLTTDNYSLIDSVNLPPAAAPAALVVAPTATSATTTTATTTTAATTTTPTGVATSTIDTSTATSTTAADTTVAPTTAPTTAPATTVASS